MPSPLTLAPSLAPRKGYLALVQRGAKGLTHATSDGQWTLCCLRLAPAAIERGEWQSVRGVAAVQCLMCRQEWDRLGR